MCLFCLKLWDLVTLFSLIADFCGQNVPILLKLWDLVTLSLLVADFCWQNVLILLENQKFNNTLLELNNMVALSQIRKHDDLPDYIQID